MREADLAQCLASLGTWRFVRGVALGALASVAIVYSLSAELTLMAGARGDVVAARNAELKAAQDARADAQRKRDRYDAARLELASLSPTRSASELQHQIDSLLLTPGADGCVEINGRVTRTVCPQVVSLREELARAQRRSELEAIIVQPLPSVPAGDHTISAADPGATAISVYLAALGLRVSSDALSEWLALVPVIALEVGSATAALLAGAYVAQPARTVTTAQVAQPENTGDAAAQKPARPVKPRKQPRRRDDDDRDAGPPKRGLPALLETVRENGGVVELGQRRLARQLGVSRTTLQRALGDLAAAGDVALSTSQAGTRVALA
jgi:hypothetical protein